VAAVSVLFVRYYVSLSNKDRDPLLKLPAISLEEFYVLGRG
jgi:hypothetical protein